MKTYRYYTPLVLQKVGYIIFWLVYKIFVKIEIRGKENLVGLKGPLILAPNHTSELDVPAIPLLLPFFSPRFPIYFVMIPTEKFKTFGWRSYLYGSGFLNLLGGYSIFSGYKDYATSLEDHITLLKAGQTLCIFPEGKRTLDGKMNPARGGLGYLVWVTKATIVPVAISTFFNMSVVDFFTRQRKVTITIGKKISANELLPQNITSESNIKLIADDFRAISQKVLDMVLELV